MERRLTEENITKLIMSWLEKNDWTIICFDFPQSGTGKVLHPSGNGTKNKGVIIPDIIAFREGKCVFFENKDRFCRGDFEKINKLKTTDEYVESIEELLKNYQIKSIYYGIGLPDISGITKKALSYKDMTDFIVCVSDKKTRVVYELSHIF